jgi:hypothetical protein
MGGSTYLVRVYLRVLVMAFRPTAHGKVRHGGERSGDVVGSLERAAAADDDGAVFDDPRCCRKAAEEEEEE